MLNPATPSELVEIQAYLDGLEEGQRDKLQKMDPALKAATLQENDSLKNQISPLGALGLPKLLEQRRLEYGIVDPCFEAQPAFDRIYVVQISMHKDDMIGSIVIPESAQSREKVETPRGIVIAAGLEALDKMRSHGIELGDIVRFIDLAPFRFVAAVVAGHPVDVLILRDGDLLDSLDTKRRIVEGKIQIAAGFDKNGKYTHYWKRNDCEDVGPPQSPWISPDK